MSWEKGKSLFLKQSCCTSTLSETSHEATAEIFSGYYLRFVHRFAEYSRPLNEATKSQAPHQVEWTRVRLDSFDMLCNSLCNSCSLVIPNQSDVFTVQTDASYVGGGVCRDGGELPVTFYSRQLKDAETRYAVTELECLAVVKAIRHFEVYLDGRTFTVQTDHRALAKLVNRHLSRWALRLQGFSFTIEYRPGARNQNADALSRQAWPTLEEEEQRSPRTASTLQRRDVGPAPHGPNPSGSNPLQTEAC